MSTKSSKSNQNNAIAQTKVATDGTVEVLYQKMGDRWFAFSIVDDEVFVGSVTPESIQDAEIGNA